MLNKKNIEILVIQLTNNYSNIIHIEELQKYSILSWGNNGIGDRWAKKIFNYCVIYSNKSYKIYSENITDKIPEYILNNFVKENKVTKKGIIGIYVFSKRINNINRSINKKIYKEIINKSCVICGNMSNIICDHKNDLYNNYRVLDINTQIISDFQPLCNHCNLQKRQICKKEKKENKIYSAKNIQRYKQYKFEFPWEKKIFDINDITCKQDTYWYDPVEFDYKIYCYMLYIIPIINEIKLKNKYFNY